MATSWALQLGDEQRLDRLAGLVDARLHGAERQVHQQRDLGVVELLDVAQHQRLDQQRVGRGEHLERVEQVEPAAGDHARGARVGVARQVVAGQLGRRGASATGRSTGRCWTPRRAARS